MFKSLFLALGLVLSLSACTSNSKDAVLGPGQIGFHHRLHRLLPNSTVSIDTQNARGNYTLSFYLADDFTGIRHVSPLPGFQGRADTRQISRWWVDQNNRFCLEYTPQVKELTTAASAWTCYSLKITQASELTLTDARQQEWPARQVPGNTLEAQGRAFDAEVQQLYGQMPPVKPSANPPPR